MCTPHVVSKVAAKDVEMVVIARGGDELDLVSAQGILIPVGSPLDLQFASLSGRRESQDGHETDSVELHIDDRYFLVVEDKGREG